MNRAWNITVTSNTATACFFGDPIASCYKALRAAIRPFEEIAVIQITVSHMEARAISEAAPPVVVVDPQGKPLGQITPIDPQTAARPAMSPEEWDEIKRRMANDDGTRYTLAEIMERVRALAPE